MIKAVRDDLIIDWEFFNSVSIIIDNKKWHGII